MLLDCGKLPSLKNGKLPSVTEHTKWNKTAEYQCIEGYSLLPTTDNKIHCESNGKWKGKLGHCIRGKIIYTYF